MHLLYHKHTPSPKCPHPNTYTWYACKQIRIHTQLQIKTLSQFKIPSLNLFCIFVLVCSSFLSLTFCFLYFTISISCFNIFLAQSFNVCYNMVTHYLTLSDAQAHSHTHQHTHTHTWGQLNKISRICMFVYRWPANHL